MALASRLPSLALAGYQPLLSSSDFGEWEAAVTGSLGHHRSRLLRPADPFEATINTANVAGFQLLHLKGQGTFELQREQCGFGVLWLPIQGWTTEHINGVPYAVEPGDALLFRPGDAMVGQTSASIEGISILIPPHLLRERSGDQRQLSRGISSRSLIQAALGLAHTAGAAEQGADLAAAALEDSLMHWQSADAPAPSLRSQQRARLIDEAVAWIQAHRHEAFSTQQLSAAMGVSIRSLQYNFVAETGFTPMAYAKRLRLQRLRALLLDPDQRASAIAACMQRAGLLACGSTAADYRRWCGESPRQTRRRLLG